MSVTVEGHRITVEAPPIEINDFLEYAEMAIGRFGWRQGERKGNDDDMVRVAEKEGLSLHDAIGYTNVVLGGSEPGKPTGKDDMTKDHRTSHSMRSQMTNAVNAVLPEGETDITFNDKAKSVDEVVAVLRQARGAA